MTPAPRLSSAASPLARRLARHIATLGAGLFVTTSAFAVDYYKADNNANLTSYTSWWYDAAGTMPVPDTNPSSAPVNTTSPTAVGIWTSLVTGPHTITTGDVGMQLIRIVNPGGPIAIDGTSSPRTVTVGNGGGIDMSQATQDLTLTNLFHRIAAASAQINLNVAAGRTLTYGTGAQINVRSNSGNTVVNINTDGTSSGTVTFAANVAASNFVIGAGHVEFNNPAGNNRISGSTSPVTTTINGGVVLVNNTSNSATGSGTVSVNSGATLGGAGIITGAVTAATGSILSPGNTANALGELRVGTLNLAAGSKLVWEASNEIDADKLTVTAADGLTINGSILPDDADENHPLISLYNPGTTEPFTGTGFFTLIGYSGAIGGDGIAALRIDPATKIDGRTYTLGLGAGGITLEIEDGTVTPIDWNTTASGHWSTGANWTGGAAPDAVKALARITGETGVTLTAPITVTLDTAPTVGKLYLDSTQAVTLAGANTLTFDQGPGAATLFASGGNHAISAPISVTTGGLTTTVDDAGQTLTLSGAISGAGAGLVKIGDGTLLLTGTNTYDGTTSVSAGTLQIGSGGTTGSVAGPIAVSETLRFDRSDSVTLAQPISGTGDVHFAGTGTTTLTVANTYNGDTTLTAGSLVLAHAEALRNTRLIYNTGGGSLTVADPVASVTLGALEGDSNIPLTNTLGASIALIVGGNNDSTAYSGSPVGTGASLTKNGSGSFAVTGTHAYSGDILVNAGTLSIDAGATVTALDADLGTASTARLLVNGGTLNAGGSFMPNTSVGLAVAGGTANFTGTLANETGNSGAEPFINVTGGVLNAGAITLSRGSLNIGSEPGSGQTGQGLYVNGGAVHVTGALGIGSISGSNSSVSGRVDSGSLTVDGLTTVGINNATRWSVLDINGGTFAANGGIQLGSAFVGQVIMHVRGSSAVVNTPGILFGQADLAGTAVLSLGGGSLYVGADGLALASSNAAFAAALRLGAGSLGATADWSSTVPVNISGFPSVVTGSSAADTPYTISLHGPVTGSGDLTKNGSGTVLFTDPTNNYQGAVIVNAGTLGLAGAASSFLDFTVNEGGKLLPIGVLGVTNTANINGGLSIRYDASASVPVPRIEGQFDVNLGANSTLDVSGVGILPAGTYVIAKGAFGVTGTFASVNLPAGITVDYDYDDGSGTRVVAIVSSGVGSPYDTWAASYSLVGDDALNTADPDGDGLVNLLEYALDTSPVLSDSGSAQALGRSGNFLTLTFNHPADASLVYQIETSNDLGTTWTTLPALPAFTTEGTYIYTDTADLTVTPRRFLRLKVTQTP